MAIGYYRIRIFTGKGMVNDYWIVWVFGIARILESLAGCRTMLLFAVFCKIGPLERNAY